MKPIEPKIIFFDIDDTLRPKETGFVPDSTRKALHMLKEKGIITAIATGRSPVVLPDDVKRLMAGCGIEILVSVNGQYISRQNRTLADFPLDKADVAAAAALFRNKGIAYALVSDSRVGIPYDSAYLHQALASLAVPYEIGGLNPDLPVYQMLAFYGQDKAAAIEGSLLPSLRGIRWHEYGVDILAKDGSKARGVRTVLDKLGLTADEAAAFGDGLNDMEMLNTVGCGVAVGNAHPDLKEVADYICPPAAEDGIWHALCDLGILD
ncbi:MAG: Cof-type HAD-IIB family hydrolase [Neisseria sp.]|nr:Cof-type HAD-IIB family hydrolase [Neisseria sp.]